MSAAGAGRTEAQTKATTSVEEAPVIANDATTSAVAVESSESPAADLSTLADSAQPVINGPGVDAGAKVERTNREAAFPSRSDDRPAASAAEKGTMSSESEPPDAGASPANGPMTEKTTTDPVSVSVSSNGDGPTVVVDLGEPATELAKPVDPKPDPQSNGGESAESTSSPPVAEPMKSGAVGAASSTAASAASVAVASAVSVTADKLSSAGAAARSFGQVIAASLATPPAGVPLLRRERRTRPGRPGGSPVASNPSATATAPDRADTPAAKADLPPAIEAPEALVDAPVAPLTPVDAPETPSAEPAEAVTPTNARASDANATTATLPPVPAIGPAPIAPVRRRPRRARLKVTRLDPWTVMKVAFLLSLAAGIMTVVAVAVLWSVLDSANVFSEVGTTLREVTGGDQGDGFDLESYLSLERVLAFTGIIAGIEVVVLTALTTLGAFLYNVSSRMAGGVEVTLAEDD